MAEKTEKGMGQVETVARRRWLLSGWINWLCVGLLPLYPASGVGPAG